MPELSDVPVSKEKIWEFADSRRGHGRPPATEFLEFLRNEGIEPTIRWLNAFYGAVEHHQDFYVPELVSSFVASVATTLQPNRILDPWAVRGALLAATVEENDGAEAVGVVINPAVLEALRSAEFPAGIEWHPGSIEHVAAELEDGFDLVVSNPPWGLAAHERDEVPGKFRRNIELYQLLQAADLLQEGGAIVAVLSSAVFFTRAGRGFQDQLAERGLAIDGVFAFPQGAMKLTSLRPYVVAITSRQKDRLFVAEMAAGKDQTQIIQNWRSYREGSANSLGSLVERDEFTSYEALESKWRADRLAERQPYKAISLDSVATEWSLLDGTTSEDLSVADNAIYVSRIGHGEVHDSPAELPEEPSNWMRVRLDSERALAGFVAAFLDTELGKALRKSLISGTTVPHTSKARLKDLSLYLPDTETQFKVLAARQKAEEASQRLDELARRAIEFPQAIGSVERDLERLSLEASLNDWMQDLPFPVASILKRYQAENRPRRQREHLFHFFEAFAEFTATVLLSGLCDSDIPDLDASALREDLRRASFGNWLNIASRLAKTTRVMLASGDKEDRRQCLQFFSAGSPEWVQALTNKDLFTALQKASKRRNAWHGHAGALSDADAARQLRELEEILTEVSGAISDRLRRISLLLPHEGRLKDGVWTFQVSVLKGPSSTFQRDTVRTVTPMEQDTLYLLEQGMETPLTLLPFIRLMAPPESEKQACYFYNRVDGEGTRWVSYHFEEEASRHTPSADFEELVARFSASSA